MRNYNIRLLVLLFLVLGVQKINAQVTLTATAGTATGTFTTLKGAFDAINAGTHQGAIVISINASTTEGTTPATLNSSGAGSANYTSVLVQPTADGLTISGNPASGFGVIQLKGADNVTIDGDNAGTGGTNRNLTIQNTVSATTAYSSVIRIATVNVAAALDAGNITIRNCNLTGNASGRNAAANTSTSGTENASFGVYIGGNGGSTATDAMSAISSVSTQIIPASTTVNALVIDNNAITQAARGIEFNGAATANSNGVTITKNDIGNATAGATSGVYSMGMTIQGSSAVTIGSNTIYIESYVAASIRAIDIGSISANVSGVTIEKNKIGRVWGNSTSGFGSYGINYAGGNTAIIQNNFISNINAYLSNGSISVNFGPHGIRIGAGTSHKIYHNSVNLYGAVIGSGSSSMVSALTITSSSSTGLDIRNNIFANTVTGAAAGTPVDCIALPSGLTSSFNLIENNNAYFSSGQLGQSGTASVSAYTIAGFNPASTAGAANWRNYTSTLLAANTNNDNASYAFSTAAPFTSSTNLHIPAATNTQLESGGATLTLLVDIDGDVRPGPAGSVNGGGTAPDIGADEFDGIPPAPMTYVSSTTTQTNTSPVGTNTTNQVVVGVEIVTSGTTSPLSATSFTLLTNGTTNISDISNAKLFYTGTTSTYSATGQFGSTISTPGATLTFTGSQTLSTGTNYFWLSYDIPCSATPANLVDAECTSLTVGSAYTPTVTNPGPGRSITIGPLIGMYSVGSGGNYATLTAAAAAVNTIGLAGNTTFEILGNITEPGVVSINQWVECGTGGYTLTIKPAAAANPVITTSSTTSLINLNGAKRVVIDGSNNATTSRNLTFSNTSTSGATVRFINGASNNTVKNCVLTGVTTATTNGVVFFSTAGITGNNNNLVQNNSITKGTTLPVNGVYNLGTSAALPNTGNTVSQNSISDFSGQGVNDGGYSSGSVYAGNQIFGTATQTSSTGLYGIFLGATSIVSPTVTGNKIFDLKTTNTSGTTGYLVGIDIYDIASGTTCTVTNNMISLSGNGTSAPGIRIAGIADESTAGTTNIYYNTISIYGAATLTNTSYALLKNYTNTTVLKNNILSNTRTSTGSGKQYSIAYVSGSGPMTSDYNDLQSTGNTQNVLGTYNGADQTTIGAWRTASSGDAASVSVLPIFTAPTDLHLVTNANCALDGAGNNNGILLTDDFDAAGVRSTNSPFATDIGADEFTGNFSLVITDPATACGSVDITAAAVTAGSSTGTTLSYWMDLAATTAIPAGNGTPSAITTSGTYYIKSVKGSCSDVKAVNVTVNARPTGVISGTTTICAGSTATLTLTVTGSGTVSGLLSDGSSYSGTAPAITVTVSPSSNTTYTISTMNDANCAAVAGGLTGSAAVTVNSASGNLAAVTGGTQVCSNGMVMPVTGSTYSDPANCDVIARIVPSGASPVSGSINTCVKIDNSVQSYGAEPYVQRHYDVEPATSPSTSTARITLYFSDNEFVTYNANSTGFKPLPTATLGNADPAIANLRVNQFHGTGTLPGNYTGAQEVINPNDADIVWNAGANRWEVTIDVNGFSGFYITSLVDAPLPITISYFKGTRQNGIHLLSWKVNCTNSPYAKLSLERSADAAGGFSQVYYIQATAARCNDPFSHTDLQPLPGMNYYRLKMTDADGKITYSGIVALLNASKGFDIVSIAPNPVVNGTFKLNVSTAQAAKMDIVIIDMQGRVVQRRQEVLQAGFNPIDMNVTGLSSGTYSLYGVTADGRSSVHRFVKQ